MLTLLMCIMCRLRGSIIACRITCYFRETVICWTCPCHCISVMLLIISHSLSNVFASKRWICYSWQNFLRPVHFYLVLLVPSRGLILISTKLKKKCFIIFQKFPLETVCALTALRVLLSLNLSPYKSRLM